ncbi:hypothetical protein LTR84_011957 [Exophiala bonariae]|uniref:Cytochrome P450 n=1 Tax=Exophiala bonariae TaxID=1690606 RepID=A0AAV9MUM8_9EURO|nr:hypothetical protein LTR84_011957 [Exophiala bonariae]
MVTISLREALLLLGVLLIITKAVGIGPFSNKRAGLAPGPPGVCSYSVEDPSMIDNITGKPFIGNLLDVPPFHSWLKFKEWADQYGPIMSINLGGRLNYIVSTEKIANDLLRERGNIYSDREQTPAGAQLLSGGLRPLLLPYNDVWRNGRKLMHHLTMTKKANSYQPTQLLESTKMLHDLIKSPKDYEFFFERYASGVIFRLAFGKRIDEKNEPILRRIVKVNHTLEKVASPGSYLVDTFPSLMYLPRFLAPWKRELEDYHTFESTLFKELLEDVKKDLKEGQATDCWEKYFVEHASEYSLTEEQGAYVIGTLFEAGSGTTAAAMMSFLLAMVHYPEWQTKVQHEIDQVVPRSRLPTFDDLPNLPTVRAMAKETVRWRPVTAGGVPHMLSREDTYNGFVLPAGTNVHANQWAIHHDKELYPDPDNYNPERWLNPKYPTYKEPLTIHPNLQNFSCFGFGRRICPGQNIAERSLFILVARIMWTCKISKAKDATGHEIDVPLYNYTTGFNAQPKSFPFELKPRDDSRLGVVEKEYEFWQMNDPLVGR